MNLFSLNNIPREKVLDCFLENEEVVLETYTLSHKEEDAFVDVLKICLKEIGKENIFDYLHYCFKELLVNAKRANTKRVFFEEKGLNINNSDDYIKGMKEFKKELLQNDKCYSSLNYEKGYYVRASFSVKDDVFLLSVINNSLIINDELNKARENIEKARIFTSIEEAFAIVHHDAEGAGLGIIILVLMLKKIGLKREAINIYRKNNETIVSIMIPLSLITTEQNKIINEIVVKEINDIPQFPEHIIELQKKLNDPEVSIKEVARLVSSDPSLIADILRAANSALFMLSRRVSSIVEAVKFIGLKGIKNLLYSYETHEILNNKYDKKKMEPIWAHSYKVAFFAFHIAKKHLPKKYLEDAYIAGMLHDIGRILLLGINPELIRKINLVCQQKGIPVRIIEDITSGYNHALIGSMIAKKWNFPENFIYAIEYHHNPLDCDDKYKDFVFCIYIANMMSYDNDHYEVYKQIENSILYYFEIQSFTQYEELVKQLNEAFDIEKSKSN